MGEVVPARTSPTLPPHPLALCCNYPVSKCPSASIVGTSTLRVNISIYMDLTGWNMVAISIITQGHDGQGFPFQWARVAGEVIGGDHCESANSCLGKGARGGGPGAWSPGKFLKFTCEIMQSGGIKKKKNMQYFLACLYSQAHMVSRLTSF